MNRARIWRLQASAVKLYLLICSSQYFEFSMLLCFIPLRHNVHICGHNFLPVLWTSGHERARYFWHRVTWTFHIAIILWPNLNVLNTNEADHFSDHYDVWEIVQYPTLQDQFEQNFFCSNEYNQTQILHAFWAYFFFINVNLTDCWITKCLFTH